MKKIKIQKILNESHSLMNDVVVGTARKLEDAELVVKLDDLLKERGLSQKDLAAMTGMRVGTISDIANGKGISFNKVQILAIMTALRIHSFNDLYEIRLPQEMEDYFKAEREQWVDTNIMPIPLKQMYKENLMKSTVDKVK